jgi:hypothetical protein
MKRRGTQIERSFAHLYETGGLRWAHLRGQDNIAKRLLIHAAAFNLSLILRRLLGVGTARQAADRLAALCFGSWRLLHAPAHRPGGTRHGGGIDRCTVKSWFYPRAAIHRCPMR